MASRTPSRSVSSGSIPTRQATPEGLSLAEQAKEGLVATACDEGDVDALVELSASTHGLVSDKLRRTAWPMLLGRTTVDADAYADTEKTCWKNLPAHREEGQVALDVNRAFVYYPKCGESWVSSIHKTPTDGLQPQKKSLIVEKASFPMSSSRCCASIQRCPTSKAITTSSKSSTLSWAPMPRLAPPRASASFVSEISCSRRSNPL